MHLPKLRSAALLLLSLVPGCAHAAAALDSGIADAVTDASDASDAPSILDGRDPRALSTVIGVHARSFVVLDASPSAEWSVGDAIDLAQEPGWLVAEREVDLGMLPADLLARTNDTWRLVAADGHACTARLSEPRLIRRAEGWLYEDDEPVVPASPEQSPLWENALEVLAAEAIAVEGDCSDARFAFAIDRAPTRVFAATELEPELASQARAAFEALPRHREIAAEYADYLATAEDSAAGPDWRSYDGADSMHIERLASPDGRVLVLVTASAGYGCGGFGASLFALFDQTPAGLALRDQGELEAAPSLVVELAGGLTAYVGVERTRFLAPAVELTPDALEASESWTDLSTPFFGCPC